MKKWLAVGFLLIFVACSPNGAGATVEAAEKMESKNKNADLEKKIAQLETNNASLKEMLKNLNQLNTVTITKHALYGLEKVDLIPTTIKTNPAEVKEQQKKLYQIVQIPHKDSKSKVFLRESYISRFAVAPNDAYVALLIFDGEDILRQKILIYDAKGEKHFEYDLEAFQKWLPPKTVDADRLILNGFSEKAEYLWIGLGSDLDVGLYFSIHMDTGELVFYGKGNREKYAQMKAQYPWYEDELTWLP